MAHGQLARRQRPGPDNRLDRVQLPEQRQRRRAARVGIDNELLRRMYATPTVVVVVVVDTYTYSFA